MSTYTDSQQRELDQASGEEMDKRAVRTVIVPNYIHDVINAKLDDAFKQFSGAEPDRDIFYQTLLNYFDEHGVIPEFSFNLIKVSKAGA